MLDNFTTIPGTDYSSPMNCSHLRCNKCGKRVEHGITRVSDHWHDCIANGEVKDLIDKVPFPHLVYELLHYEPYPKKQQLIPYGKDWDYELDILKAKLHERIEAR